MHRTAGLAIMLLVALALFAGCGNAVPTPTPTPTPSPTPTPQQRISPTVEAALESLFWAAAAIAGVERDTPFEQAKTSLRYALFQSLDSNLKELEKYGVNYKTDLPYCLNATFAAAAILALEKSDSPVDAAPDVNRAIEALTAMDDDIELARDPERPTLPSEDQLQLCALAVEEVTQKGR